MDAAAQAELATPSVGPPLSQEDSQAAPEMHTSTDGQDTCEYMGSEGVMGIFQGQAAPGSGAPAH